VSKQIKFLVTRELGRLAKWLRILGFDAEVEHSSINSCMIIASLRDNRIILTRKKSIGARRGLRFVYLKSDFFKSQLAQVIEELGLVLDNKKFFSRCVLCNKLLTIIEKDKIRNKVPEYVLKTQEVFYECASCRRIYWKGTHWGNAEELVNKILKK